MSSSNSSAPPPTPTSTSSSNSSTVTPPPRTSSGGYASTAIAVVLASVSLVVILALVLFKRQRRRKRKRKDLESRDCGHLSLQSHHSLSSSRPSVSIDENPQKYSYEELSTATKNFSESELLGAGAFGSVYRGILPEDGTYVAVKCITEKSSQAAKQYRAEVTIISDLRHRNLVRLLSWCHDQGKFLLVYEYMANGSLDHLLFNDSLCFKLRWERRYSIAAGLGLALQYLHEECDKVIIHRDIKCSNLLLDENFSAKLGDFGLSRQVEQGITSHTTTLAGTRGYMAPELFFGSGKATRETDVFAFGGVLLELVSGKHVIERSLTKHDGMLVDWVWHLHSQGKVMEAVDRRMEGRYEEEEARRMLMVGLICSAPNPNARPKMRVAVEALMGTVAWPAVPPYKPSLLFRTSPSFAKSTTYADNTTTAT